MILADLLTGDLVKRHRLVNTHEIDREVLAAAYGKKRARDIIQGIIDTLRQGGLSIPRGGKLLRLPRVNLDFPQDARIYLTALFKHPFYQRYKNPWREVHHDVNICLHAGLLDLQEDKRGEFIYFVKPSERLHLEQTKCEALAAYFEHLLTFGLTRKQRNGLTLAVEAARSRYLGQTLHARMKELLTKRQRPGRMTVRDASVYLNELDTSLSRKLNIRFKFTALEEMPGIDLDPKRHPEFYPGYVIHQMEVLLRDHLSDFADKERVFNDVVAGLRHKLLAPTPLTADERQAEEYFDWEKLWRKVGGLAQAHDLKAHELLLLRAVAEAWEEQPLTLAELHDPYEDVCHAWSVPASERSAVYKYAARLTKAGYLTKQVGKPRYKHTAARRVSYYTLQKEKAQGLLEKLEVLKEDVKG